MKRIGGRELLRGRLPIPRIRGRAGLAVAVFAMLAGCSPDLQSDSHIYTLYSTNFPHDTGRSGISTFNLSTEDLNSLMCQEAAELYKGDFERQTSENPALSQAKFRVWCEKGRFRK